MPEENKNNFIDDFRSPSSHPTPQPRRELNYRQPTRPVVRGNYTGSTVPAQQTSAQQHYQDNESVPTHNQAVGSPVAQNATPQQPPTHPSPNSTDNMSLDDDLDNLFPKSDNHIVPHKVGADLVVKKLRLPKGVYLIFILSLILLPASVLNGANTTYITSALLLISFVLSSMMLFKKELARKLMTYLSIAIVVITIGFAALFYLQSKSTNDQFTKNFNEIKSTSGLKMSLKDKGALALTQSKIIVVRDKQIKAKDYFYAFSSFLIVENVIILFYLRRSKVKVYFMPEIDITSHQSS